MSYEKIIEDKLTKQANSFAKNPIRRVFILFITIGVIVFGINIITGIFSTASTVASSPGRVINKTLETENIIESYEWFYDVNAAFDTRLGQVQEFSILYQQEQEKLEKNRIRIDLSAMRQTCRELAAKYNANSEKMNKSIFKGWNLPKSLNIRDCG